MEKDHKWIKTEVWQGFKFGLGFWFAIIFLNIILFALLSFLGISLLKLMTG